MGPRLRGWVLGQLNFRLARFWNIRVGGSPRIPRSLRPISHFPTGRARIPLSVFNLVKYTF